MKFCDEHWERLKDTVRQAGLWSLVSEDGEHAARKLQSEMSDGSTVDNFDPLMAAHNLIFAGAMKTISDLYGQNPLMVFADSEDNPDWACPICALGWCHEEHVRLCTQADCDFPKEYDWASFMINRAVEGALAEWKRLGTAT